jgi:hypothetical protein
VAIVAGFDPGGRQAVGWCVVDDVQNAVLSHGVTSNASDAVEAAAATSPAPPVAVGIDAPLFWRRKGDRRVDQFVRRKVRTQGGRPQSVVSINSLRGSCLVQGLLLAMLARARWPGAIVSESHPGAVRACAQGLPIPTFPPGAHPGPHERDAAAASLSATAANGGLPGWTDLSAFEVDMIAPIAPAPSYWFPSSPAIQIGNYPMATIPRNGRTYAPAPVTGEWMHSADNNTIAAIQALGWSPNFLRGTIYGTAVYLSRGVWHGLPASIRGRLELAPHEVLSEFESVQGGRGNTQDHLLWYLQERLTIPAPAVVHVVGRNPRNGTHVQNATIRDHFLGLGVRAVHFIEHGLDVVAAYDPNCIRVL